MFMKKRISLFLIYSLIILSLTGCEDSIDIILTETSFTEASTPYVIESIPNEITESTSLTTNVDITEALVQETTVTTRPDNINEALERYEWKGLDISFEPIDETEATVLAKKYVKEMREAVDCIADTTWSTIIDLDEYIDDGYLKDYILFELNIFQRRIKGIKRNYMIERLEAVEQKQVGDIIYIGVRYFVQYISERTNNWVNECGTEWVGIRNGRIVNESILAGGHVDSYIGIDTDIIDFGNFIYYCFQSDVNPWDNIEDIKKIYNGLKSQGFGIEMKEYPQPN